MKSTLVTTLITLGLATVSIADTQIEAMDGVPGESARFLQ